MAPKGFDQTHPDIDLIRMKQFIVKRSFSDAEVLADDFVDKLLEAYAHMRPFFDYYE
ncbi:MAG: DUF2461 family protein [Bacteroidetes bacterium]|nr:MAG: DUF2461 family protein [Bacteroidota bacterium]